MLPDSRSFDANNIIRLYTLFRGHITARRRPDLLIITNEAVAYMGMALYTTIRRTRECESGVCVGEWSERVIVSWVARGRGRERASALRDRFGFIYGQHNILGVLKS